MLQWGRDQWIAEMYELPDISNLTGHASMGPRSMDRGNIFGCSMFRRAAWGASMGPRSMDRGNDDVRSCLLSAYMLQWGRDQWIAEIRNFDWRNSPAILLQWGRDQWIAEIKIP